MATDPRSHDQRVMALYARVIRRVCERFEGRANAADEDADTDAEAARGRWQEAAARIEQQWRARLTRYTGLSFAAEGLEEGEAVRNRVHGVAAKENMDSACGDDGEESTHAVRLGETPPPPQTLLQLRAPSSIFESILLGKRKIEQLDGSVEGEGEDLEESGAQLVDGTRSSSPPSLPSVPGNAVARATDIAPTTALNGSDFPIQCAARDVNFAFKKDILRGKWKNAILTMLRPVNADADIGPGRFLWLTRELGSSREALGDRSMGVLPACVHDFDNRGGTVVQVEKGGGPDDAWLVVRVATTGQTHRVRVHETRCLSECVVRSCSAQFRFVHQ